MLDKLLAASGRYRFAGVSTEGRDPLYAEAAGGRGGLMVTTHMGCLEIGRAMAEHRGELHLNILVHTRHAVRFNSLLKRLDPHSQVTLIEDPPASTTCMVPKIPFMACQAIAPLDPTPPYPPVSIVPWSSVATLKQSRASPPPVAKS